MDKKQSFDVERFSEKIKWSLLKISKQFDNLAELAVGFLNYVNFNMKVSNSKDFFLVSFSFFQL